MVPIRRETRRHFFVSQKNDFLKFSGGCPFYKFYMFYNVNNQ